MCSVSCTSFQTGFHLSTDWKNRQETKKTGWLQNDYCEKKEEDQWTWKREYGNSKSHPTIELWRGGLRASKHHEAEDCFFRIRSTFKLQVAISWVETLKVAGGKVRCVYNGDEPNTYKWPNVNEIEEAKLEYKYQARGSYRRAEEGSKRHHLLLLLLLSSLSTLQLAHKPSPP